MTTIADWKDHEFLNINLDNLRLDTPTGLYVNKLMTALKKKFDAVDAKLAKVEGALVNRGEKATVSALPETGNSVGDYWTITADGSEWAWNGTEWYEIGRDAPNVSEATGTLPVNHGGTGSTSQNFVDLSTDQSVSGAKAFAEGPYGTTSAVSATEIDLGDGVVFTKTIAADTTFTITGVPSGKAATFNLILTNGGAYTVTWPASVEWSSDTPPALTSSGTDVLTFLTPDGGTTWYGTVALSGVTA